LFVAKDSYKTIMALQNPKTSFIKKRQLMRATFGDYRSKMAKEEKDIKFSKFESNRNLKTASFKILPAGLNC